MAKNSKSMPSTLSYEELTEEITKLRGFISQYNKGLIPYSGFNYRHSLWTLEHLLNKRRALKKGVKNDG